MPRTLREGEAVNGYVATKLLNVGMMAWAFAAKAPDGQKVFLKQYRSPSVAVDWYKGYVNYQRELKTRIQSKPVHKFCVKLIDQFEAKVGPLTFFQVFEFVEGGHDLEKILERIRVKPSSVTWEQRLIWSRVFLAGINQLHEAGVVHGDLKPPNVQFLEDRGITAGWKPKLIDMDFSIIADKRAPWHGKAAYVGSPRYFSPEHLQSEVPQPASDVFTCGLILYQLLADMHPYGKAEDPAEYLAEAKKHSAPKPKLVGRLRGEDAVTNELMDCLHRCLDPNSRNRPTAREVNLALNGRTVEPPAPAIARPPTPTPTDAHSSGAEPSSKARSSPTPTPKAGKLTLVNDSGAPLEISITTRIGRPLLRRFGSEAEFADGEQFVLEVRDDVWFAVPVTAAKNHTLLNGNPLESATGLKDGDVIALGSRSGSRTALPLTVKLR